MIFITSPELATLLVHSRDPHLVLVALAIQRTILYFWALCCKCE